MILHSILLPLLLMGLTVLPARAETPPESVDLATVLALARKANPRLVLEQQNIAVARAERRTASAYPNPTVSYSYLRQPNAFTNYEGTKAQEISIEQPLLIAGQRGARIEAAERNISAAQARFDASGNQLAADAGVAFITLLAAQKKQAALAAGMTELGRLQNIVAGRQENGMASRYDLLRIDVELAAWHTRSAEADAELTVCQARLATLLGFADWKPRGTGELFPLSMGTEHPDDVDKNPILVAAGQEEAAARANTETARRERFPNVSLTAGRFWTSAPFGATNTIGIAVEVPIFETRGGAFDRAKAEEQLAGLRRYLAKAEVQADEQRYATLVAQRMAALDHFREQLEPRLPSLKQMAEDAYQLGKSSIIELLDAVRVRYETQLNHLELLSGLIEAQLRLQAVRGDFAMDWPDIPK
ncbi:TolC family protein [Nitrosomonas sp.]|uniref:TolC family protein n=1 Tax=Nitrosomonas sp. TaxID=42353 RepID=UPI0026006419|nr:TolC family protein [Nitrosomonas sp.]MCC6917007.1 TolC family protein [Nitrosomonas sp.]